MATHQPLSRAALMTTTAMRLCDWWLLTRATASKHTVKFDCFENTLCVNSRLCIVSSPTILPTAYCPYTFAEENQWLPRAALSEKDVRRLAT